MSINKIYRLKKENLPTKEEVVEKDYNQHLYNVLARYMFSVGEIPSKCNSKEFYKFYSKELGVTIPKHNRRKWLFQIARQLERNEHKNFKLENLK